MSKENLDLVRSVFAEWERGEFSTRPEWADPGMEFEIPDGPEPSTRTGIDASPGVEAFLGLWEHLRFEAEEYRELDDGSVLALSRMTGPRKGQRRGRGPTQGEPVLRLQRKGDAACALLGP